MNTRFEGHVRASRWSVSGVTDLTCDAEMRRTCAEGMASRQTMVEGLSWAWTKARSLVPSVRMSAIGLPMSKTMSALVELASMIERRPNERTPADAHNCTPFARL